LNFVQFVFDDHAFFFAMLNDREPQSYFEAKDDPLWRKVMQKELLAMYANRTWTIMDILAGKHPIRCK
jgi:hypothetical protein